MRHLYTFQTIEEVMPVLKIERSDWLSLPAVFLAVQ